MNKREEEADKDNMTDREERDLYVRYNMDMKIWRKAQRHHFPYNVSLEMIVGLPFCMPIIFLVIDLGMVD